jgi:hypothetical protein
MKMIDTNTMLALSEPLPQWLNFLAMAGAILLVAAGTLVWFLFYRKGRKPRKRKRRHHHHREPRALNPTLAQTGGLPPARKDEKNDTSAPPP